MNNQFVTNGRYFLASLAAYKCNTLPYGSVHSVEENSYKDGSPKTRGFYTWIFDEQGALSSEAYYNAGRCKTLVNEYAYDLDYCLASVTTFFIQDNSKSITSYQFYPVENVIGEIIKYTDGTETETIFMIDSSGRIAGKYNKKNRDNVEIVQFDSSNRIITSTTENIQGEVTQRTELEYNDRSMDYTHCNSIDYTDKMLLDINRIYLYDTYGNWIRRDEQISLYESGTLRSVEKFVKTREISYRS